MEVDVPAAVLPEPEAIAEQVVAPEVLAQPVPAADLEAIAAAAVPAIDNFVMPVLEFDVVDAWESLLEQPPVLLPAPASLEPVHIEEVEAAVVEEAEVVEAILEPVAAAAVAVARSPSYQHRPANRFHLLITLNYNLHGFLSS